MSAISRLAPAVLRRPIAACRGFGRVGGRTWRHGEVAYRHWLVATHPRRHAQG